MCSQCAPDAPPVAEQAAAGSGAEQGSGEEEGSAEPEYLGGPSIPIRVTPVGEDINNFANSLYAEVAPREGNFIVSPVSVAASLHLALAGAEGRTLSGINRAVWARRDRPDLLEASGEMLRAITASEGVDVAIANRLWIDESWVERLLPTYREAVQANFGAAIGSADFVNAAEPSRDAMNAWVAQHTRERVPELLPEGIITSLTRMVIINAVYFNGAWATPFDPAATAPGDFDGPNGNIRVDYMHRAGEMLYADNETFWAVRLPYAGGAFEMVVVVPKPGPNGRSVGMAPIGSLHTAAESAVMTQVDAYIPSFTFRWNSSLKESLIALGMEDAFEQSADFSSMFDLTDTDGLYVADVVHEAFIEVDEAGTEAAAATAVVMATRGAARPVERVEFRADRQFYFAIRHLETGAFLFFGRVDDPNSDH